MNGGKEKEGGEGEIMTLQLQKKAGKGQLKEALPTMRDISLCDTPISVLASV